MPKAATIKSDSPQTDGETAFAHMFRTPMAFASSGNGVETTLKVSIEHSTTDALLRAERQPSRGGAANHSPSYGQG